MPGPILENVHQAIPVPETHRKRALMLEPRHAVLKGDHSTQVTLYPIANGAASIPQDLVRYLCSELNAEIERGCTYPFEETLSTGKFADFWFGTFAVVVLLGNQNQIQDRRDWARECLGSFYIKPNYPGR
jgi:hypothetical protein